MVRSVRLRFAAVPLVAGAIIALTAVSAWAFNQQTLANPGTANSNFADPDDQVTTGPGARPLGSNGPTVQFGVQQGQSAPFGRFQGFGPGNNNNAGAPDFYSKPLGNGN